MAMIFVPTGGQAQNERIRLSSPEDVAIAFYRTANITPDFKIWVWDRSPYVDTPAAKRKQVFEEELARLQQAFLSFNKRRDYLTLRIPVDINLSENGDEYNLDMKIKGVEQANYVSYPFLTMEFAIFPFNMDKIMNSKIDFDLYDRLRTLQQEKQTPYLVVVNEVTQADPSRPYEIEGASRWVLKTKIQFMTLYTQSGQVLWEYLAPSTLSP